MEKVEERGKQFLENVERLWHKNIDRVTVLGCGTLPVLK